MADQQQADLKVLLGDGNAKVTVSREISENDYGNGGKTFCSVTLTCDQSIQVIDAAQKWADHFASKYCSEQHIQMKKDLASKGILKP